MFIIGGKGGIRTLGTSFLARSFSKRLVSASHPLFHKPNWVNYITLIYRYKLINFNNNYILIM